MAGVGRICKIRFLRPEKEAPEFLAQRTHVREHQKQDFNAVRPKKTGLRKYARQAHPTRQNPFFCVCLFVFCLSAFIAFSAFHPGPASKAGRGVAFLKLAGADAEAMAGVE